MNAPAPISVIRNPFSKDNKMPDLKDGETVEVQGSARTPYILKNVGGVYSCSCPAWRNQSVSIERRTCKHIRSYRGEQAEQDRLGSLAPAAPKTAATANADTAPKLLLANSWQNDTDLTGWWMSEKLDGVRAWWDGQQFLSRLGNVYHAPDWFVAGLPAVPLDGELWLDRKAFQRTVSIVRRQDKSDHWQQIKYVLFDAPGVSGLFEERQKALSEMIRH
jgi:DNA ligase-1